LTALRSLAEHTWLELRHRPVVLIPVGSTEQHGPHLPLDTDTVIATAVARALADELDAYVAPELSIGASGEHQDFPGVISIGTSALTTVLVEVGRSLSLWAGRIVFVNGHGGNLSAVTTACSQLVAEAHAVAWVPCSSAGDAHAGRTETSLMLHLARSLVRLDRREPGNTTPLRQLMPQLVASGVRTVSPNGVLGDPTKATAAEGAAIFAAMVEGARREI
jgi:mycofactocin precursor peptide peptidase